MVQFAFGKFKESEKRGFWGALAQAYSLIFVSEIGDRTFFMVIIFVARFNPYVLFLLAALGMAFMHILSTLVGTALATLFKSQKFWVQIVVTALFTGIGIYMVIETLVKLYCDCKKKKKKKDGDDSDSSSSDEEKSILEALEEYDRDVLGIDKS